MNFFFSFLAFLMLMITATPAMTIMIAFIIIMTIAHIMIRMAHNMMTIPCAPYGYML